MNRTLLLEAIDTINYYALVCGEDDQDTPAKQTIKVLKAELAKLEPEPTQARDVFEMSLAYKGHRISKQITGIEIRNTRCIEKLILDTLVEMGKSVLTEARKEQL